MARTNLKDEFAPEQRDAFKPKIVARNTFKYVDASGAECYRLHHTDVVKKLRNGSVVLNSGGWKTVTTKDRINSYSPFPVYSEKGVWYVYERVAPWSNPNQRKVAFFDGITLPRDFAKQSKSETETKRQNKLKKQINEFVCETIPMKGELPQPGAGDCWMCSMFYQEKPVQRGCYSSLAPQNSAAQDVEHLREHVREKYMHGSLIVNAMRFAGYQDAGIGMWLSGGFGDNSTVRRAVRRYLGRKLGLASH